MQISLEQRNKVVYEHTMDGARPAYAIAGLIEYCVNGKFAGWLTLEEANRITEELAKKEKGDHKNDDRI